MAGRERPSELVKGQWWALPDVRDGLAVHRDCWRLVPIDVTLGLSLAARSLGRDADDFIYLGNGERPDASPWMIETLAAHSWLHTEQPNSLLPPLPWSAVPEEAKAGRRERVASLLSDPQATLGIGFQLAACLLDVRRILLSLGWA